MLFPIDLAAVASSFCAAAAFIGLFILIAYVQQERKRK